MEILAILAQVRELLQQQGRLSYRILKMQFQLDDEQLEVLKDELINIQELALDKDGKMLVWAGRGEEAKRGRGETEVVSAQLSVVSPQSPDLRLQTSDPGHWTPPHLAERIRAEQAAMEARGATDG